jgi:hypothetical protein
MKVNLLTTRFVSAVTLASAGLVLARVTAETC